MWRRTQVGSVDIPGWNQGQGHANTRQPISQFCIWLLSPEARFLETRFVWVNWDLDELVARRDDFVKTRALTLGLEGAPV
jgi:hypothetical protein